MESWTNVVIYLEDSSEYLDLWLVMIWFGAVVLIGGGLCMNLAPAVLKACFDITANHSIQSAGADAAAEREKEVLLVKEVPNALNAVDARRKSDAFAMKHSSTSLSQDDINELRQDRVRRQSAIEALSGTGEEELEDVESSPRTLSPRTYTDECVSAAEPEKEAAGTHASVGIEGQSVEKVDTGDQPSGSRCSNFPTSCPSIDCELETGKVRVSKNPLVEEKCSASIVPLTEEDRELERVSSPSPLLVSSSVEPEDSEVVVWEEPKPNAFRALCQRVALHSSFNSIFLELIDLPEYTGAHNRQQRLG